MISNGDNLVFISAASVWEIRIKEALGKLELPSEFREVLLAQPFLFLDVAVEHAHAVARLPFHHRDRFDRMLLAQAGVERLTLVTHDSRFRDDGVPVIDA